MSHTIRQLFRHLVLLLLAALWIIPLYLVLVNGSTDPKEYATKSLWAPPGNFALLDNMRTAWDAAKLGQAIGSTFFYAVLGAALAVVLSAAAAYGLVGLNVRFGFFWFLLIYAGTIFPFQMYLSPLYSLYTGVDLYNTHLGLLIFYVAIAIPFATFVIRNHFLSIPRDVPEAAKLDGASSFRVLWQQFAPLSLNAFATVFVLQFTWIWNDLLFGLTLSRSEDIRPIMTALAALTGQYARTGVSVALAGTLIASLPTFILFFAIQRVFVRGMVVAGDQT